MNSARRRERIAKLRNGGGKSPFTRRIMNSRNNIHHQQQNHHEKLVDDSSSLSSMPLMNDGEVRMDPESAQSNRSLALPPPRGKLQTSSTPAPIPSSSTPASGKSAGASPSSMMSTTPQSATRGNAKEMNRRHYQDEISNSAPTNNWRGAYSQHHSMTTNVVRPKQQQQRQQRQQQTNMVGHSRQRKHNIAAVLHPSPPPKIKQHQHPPQQNSQPEKDYSYNHLKNMWTQRDNQQPIEIQPPTARTPLQILPSTPQKMNKTSISSTSSWKKKSSTTPKNDATDADNDTSFDNEITTILFHTNANDLSYEEAENQQNATSTMMRNTSSKRRTSAIQELTPKKLYQDDDDDDDNDHHNQGKDIIRGKICRNLLDDDDDEDDESYDAENNTKLMKEHLGFQFKDNQQSTPTTTATRQRNSLESSKERERQQPLNNSRKDWLENRRFKSSSTSSSFRTNNRESSSNNNNHHNMNLNKSTDSALNDSAFRPPSTIREGEGITSHHLRRSPKRTPTKKTQDPYLNKSIDSALFDFEAASASSSTSSSLSASILQRMKQQMTAAVEDPYLNFDTMSTANSEATARIDNKKQGNGSNGDGGSSGRKFLNFDTMSSSSHRLPNTIHKSILLKAVRGRDASISTSSSTANTTVRTIGKNDPIFKNTNNITPTKIKFEDENDDPSPCKTDFTEDSSIAWNIPDSAFEINNINDQNSTKKREEEEEDSRHANSSKSSSSSSSSPPTTSATTNKTTLNSESIQKLSQQYPPPATTSSSSLPSNKYNEAMSTAGETDVFDGISDIASSVNLSAKVPYHVKLRLSNKNSAQFLERAGRGRDNGNITKQQELEKDFMGKTLNVVGTVSHQDAKVKQQQQEEGVSHPSPHGVEDIDHIDPKNGNSASLPVTPKLFRRTAGGKNDALDDNDDEDNDDDDEEEEELEREMNLSQGGLDASYGIAPSPRFDVPTDESTKTDYQEQLSIHLQELSTSAPQPGEEDDNKILPNQSLSLDSTYNETDLNMNNAEEEEMDGEESSVKYPTPKESNTGSLESVRWVPSMVRLYGQKIMRDQELADCMMDIHPSRSSTRNSLVLTTSQNNERVFHTELIGIEAIKLYKNDNFGFTARDAKAIVANSVENSSFRKRGNHIGRRGKSLFSHQTKSSLLRKAHEAHEMAMDCLQEKDIESAMEHYEIFLEERQKEESCDVAHAKRKIDGMFLHNIGSLHLMIGDCDLGKEFLTQAIAEFQSNKDLSNRRDTASSLNEIGIACFANGCFDDALRFYADVLSILKETNGNESVEMTNALNNIAATHFMLNDSDSAIEALCEGLEIYRSFLIESFRKESKWFKENLVKVRSALQGISKIMRNMAHICTFRRSMEEAKFLMNQAAAIESTFFGDYSKKKGWNKST